MPAFIILAALALLAGGILSVVAFRSGTAAGVDATGKWSVGLIVHRGPEAERVGQSASCTGTLRQTGIAIEGELECDLLGTSREVTGFVFAQSNDVRIVALFPETTIEISAETVSAIQMIGSWEDSQGFEGRFVATKVELARP